MNITYEVGDRLYWFDFITDDVETEPGPNAPERYATVTYRDDCGYVYFRFDDGVEDWMPEQNMFDFFERVTWDAYDEAE